MSGFVNTVDLVGDEALFDSIVSRSITEISDNIVTSLSNRTFYDCTKLTKVNFASVKSIDDIMVFNGCSSLQELNFASLTKVPATVFSYRRSLTKAIFPAAEVVDDRAFIECKALKEVDFSAATSLGNEAFKDCTSLTKAYFPSATSVGDRTFGSCASLTEAYFPVATKVGKNAFQSCLQLASVNFNALQIFPEYMFHNCQGLTYAKFPSATILNNRALQDCLNLVTLDLPVAMNLGVYSVQGCGKLTALILRNTSNICSLYDTLVIAGTPIASGTGYIYVPRSLLSDDDASKDYRRATNWSAHAAQFRALEDYTVDGTITGELDPTKIAA